MKATAMSASALRIIVVDDHQMFRETLVSQLGYDKRFDVIAQTDNGSDALALAREQRPDILLLDINLRGMDGLETLRLLRPAELSIRVIMLSMHADPVMVGRALSLGVAGYVLKDAPFAELMTAITQVSAGRRYLSAGLDASQQVQLNEQSDTLSEREREVLLLIASGLGNAEIATKLGRSVKTVESHRSNLSRKLGIKNTAGLTRYAIREGLISP